MAENLLEKALETKSGRRMEVSNDEITLALAWLRGDITTKQVAGAYGVTHQSNCMYRLTLAIKQAFSNGNITIK